MRYKGRKAIFVGVDVMAVFVISKNKQPLMPCSEKRARLLLSRGRAVVHKLHPFTIRLKYRMGGELQAIRLKYDPGSRKTGIAIVREAKDGIHTLWLGEIEHRGDAIHNSLKQRSNYRRRRRSSNLPYRAARFSNRKRRQGWLAPSLQSRVDNIDSQTRRVQKVCPIAAISVETARFDTQKLQDPTIDGVGYQQGSLYSYEVREFVLEQWGRECAYCGKKNTPLHLDHIIARSCNGSDRPSNLIPACKPCNDAKGAHSVEEFLATKPALLARIQACQKKPLRDAAAVTTIRWAVYLMLKSTGLNVEMSSGGRTKWNRSRLAIPKTHALDAVCVGEVEVVYNWQIPVLAIKARGRGSYQRTRVTKDGFPRGYLTRSKHIHGFQTGDLIRAEVATGKKVGVYTGRVAIRATGSFNIQVAGLKTIEGISYKDCRLLMRADGYTYSYLPKGAALPPRL
jgi:5-methylcytosine-specific restriction endonuclease McrA